MGNLHQNAIRTLIAMQVAVIEHNDESLGVDKAIMALKKLDREWQKTLRELSKL